MSLTTGLILMAIVIFIIIILISLRDAKKNIKLHPLTGNREPAFTRYTEWHNKRRHALKEPVLSQPEKITAQNSLEEPHLQNTNQFAEQSSLDTPTAAEAFMGSVPPFPEVTEQKPHESTSVSLSEKTGPDRILDCLENDSNNLSLDYIAYIPGHEPLDRQQVWHSYRQNEYLLEKPHQLFGYEPSAQVWHSLEQDPENSCYTDLAITLQLANANGEASESELTRFTQLVLRLAEQFSRRFQFSDSFEQAQIRANQLNTLRQRFDVLLVLNIVPLQGVFQGNEIKRCAEYAGLQLGIDRVFDYPVDAPVFSMANLYNPGYFEVDRLDQLECRGLTLFLRVPVIVEPLQQFEVMIKKARTIADSIHGSLVDENSSPLSDRGTHLICQQLADLIAQMRKSGIEPGGGTAQRLF